MAATELQQLQSLNRRDAAWSRAGAGLRNEVESILSFNGLTTDEIRDALQRAVDEFNSARSDAQNQYQEEGLRMDKTSAAALPVH